jgi:hypothetical protein
MQIWTYGDLDWKLLVMSSFLKVYSGRRQVRRNIRQYRI